MPPSPLHQDTPLPPPTEAEAAALAWFSRCRQGLSAEQETEFENWLTADPRHAALFNEFDGTWALLGRVEGARPVVVREAPRAQAWRFLARWGVPAAAAAALLLTYFTWWVPTHYRGGTVTGVGNLRTLHLPDGSLVTMNTDSAVSAAFTPEQRRIKLERGEAHFTVARNAKRPFVVEARGVAIRAVGTAFNVHLEDKAVEVLVTEGKVRVDDAVSGQSLLAPPADMNGALPNSLGPSVLSSGQKIVVTLPAPVARMQVAVTQVSPEEMQRKLAWQERRLDFELATLGEIVAEFNRYSRHKIVIGDSTLAQKRFGGSFKPYDQAGFVRMLQQNFGVAVEETEGSTVLRTGR